MKSWKFFILLFFLINIVNAQNASTREWNIFRNSILEYQKGHYEVALQSFSLMINRRSDSALETANQLMLAKTNYKMGAYDVSLRQCEEFKRNYPQSSYIDDISYLTGNNYFRLKRTENAVIAWLNTGFETDDKVLRDKSFKLADDVIRYRLNKLSLQNLYNQNEKLPISEAFRYHIADDLYRNGNKSEAKNELSDLLSFARTTYYKSKAQELLEKINGLNTGQKNIAALLPLTGSNEAVGKALLAGIELAAQQYNATKTEKVIITPFDYSSRMITALEQIKKICSDPNYIAVFGPVENDISAACASVADYEGITVISPTASADQITELSQNYINLAPTVNTMSQAIQSFVQDSLQVKRIATLTPLDDYFLRMTEVFKSAFEENGGTVSAQEWYYPGDESFKKQFRSLKRIGLKIEFKDSLLLENPDITDSRVDTLYREYLIKQQEALKETKTKLDSADIPVVAFDGMFIPVYEDDISFMASQFAYANFKTQLIGNSDWYNKDALKKNRNYINGIVFVTDGYLNEESWDYRQFRNNFRDTFKLTPDKYEIIGYDSFKYLLNVFANNKEIDRSSFLEMVIRQKPYYGIYRNIDIDHNRSNKSARVLKYLFGQVIPIK